MKLSELQEKLNLTTVSSSVYDKDISGVFMSDMVSEVMASAKPGCVLITIQTHKNILAAANLVDVGAIIFTNGKKPDQEVITLADRAKLTLLSTDEQGWQFAGKLYELGIR